MSRIVTARKQRRLRVPSRPSGAGSAGVRARWCLVPRWPTGWWAKGRASVPAAPVARRRWTGTSSPRWPARPRGPGGREPAPGFGGARSQGVELRAPSRGDHQGRPAPATLHMQRGRLHGRSATASGGRRWPTSRPARPRGLKGGPQSPPPQSPPSPPSPESPSSNHQRRPACPAPGSRVSSPSPSPEPPSPRGSSR